MRRFSIVGVCLLMLGISCAQPKPPVQRASVPAPRPQPKPVSEVRAVWVSDTAKLDWDTATRELQRAGFNTMYVNFASAGVAFYPNSRVLPSPTEQPDPIARGIALAHQRGIAVYAKLLVMFSYKSPPDFQRMLLKSDRVMRGADGKPIVQSGCYWICPSDPANREQVLAVVGEMLSRYPVDGIQFDYMRFNEAPSCYCSRCQQAAAKFHGTFNEWRQSLITDWARDLSTKARQTRPGIKVSAAVFPILANAREDKGQDWRLWLARGYLDTICPMNYTTDPQEFEARARDVLANAPRDRVVMGIPGWKFDRLDGEINEINLTRRWGLAGFALFSYDDAAARQSLPNVNPR